MWGKVRSVAVVVGLALCSVALAQKNIRSSHISGPEVATDRGSLSFRGLHVAVGGTSPAHNIVVGNRGGAPLNRLNALTHGDFVITASTCSQALGPTGSGNDTCTISVAFRPTMNGKRSGDLTVQAADVQTLVVPLDAGTPIDFPTLQPGATAVEWVELPAETTAVSGTVTGPFAIALQASYVYGSIGGVTFASSAASDGVCGTGATPCGVYLGVEFLGTSTMSEATGTVTLSNGLTYTLSANVVAPGVVLTPVSFDGGSVSVGSISDPFTVSITNVQSTPITLDAPSVSGPFSITDGCSSSLAAGATCTINISFAPTATGVASGELQVTTSLGNLIASLSGTGLDNPANVQISPATITFALTPPTFAGTRTVKLTNLSSVDSVQAGALTLSSAFFCLQSSDVLCLVVAANTCTTLAPLATCQIQLRYQGESGEFPEPGSVQIPLTPSSSTTAFTYIIPFTQTLPSATTSVLSVSPAVLQFPKTPFGQPSGPLTVSVTNLSQSAVGITASSIPDFIIDPSCGPLLPGKSCSLSVHYVPVSGAGQANGQLTINAFDTANPSTTGSATVSVTGFGTPAASIASPSYPPLFQPLNLDLTGGSIEISNPSTTPLMLGSIDGLSTAIAADASDCGASIPPGGSCTVNVSLNEGCPDLTSNCQLGVYSDALSSPDIYQVISQQSGGAALITFYFAPSDSSLRSGGYPGVPTTIPFVFPSTAGGASATSTFLVQVGSLGSFGGVSLFVTPNVSSDFTVNNQCPQVLVPQLVQSVGAFVSNCNFSLTFAPQSPGFHAGTITLSTSLGLWTMLIAGTTAPAPPLSVSPATLVLSALPGKTDAGTVLLTNMSSAPLSLAAPALAGPQAADFKITQTTCSSSLAAGATCTIQVTYTNPEYLSAAQLIVASGNNDVQTVTLTGVIPELLVTSNGGSFQFTSIGNQTSGLFTLTTFKGAPITIQSVTITGANASDFKIASTTCTASFVLQGTTSCVVDVAFTPLEIGYLSANLTIVSSASTFSPGLYGIGALGPAQVSPTALMFGNQAVLIQSAAQLITLTNPNPQALTVPALPALSGANPSDFTISGSCTTIPANSACSLSVVFKPSATGTRTAAITIGTGTTVDPNNGQPVNASTTVNFTGVGVVLGPGATVHPLRLHFHRRRVGSASEARKVFLANPGTTTLMLPAPPTITGTDPKEFQLSGNCASIAAKGWCELGVRFTPAAEGDRSATLSIPTGGSANGSVSVLLTGNGCVPDRREERHDGRDLDCREKWKEQGHDQDRDHKED